MRPIRLTHCALALAALSLAAPATADVVVLKDGSRLVGRIQNDPNRPERLGMILPTGRIELQRARIAEIIEESDAQDFTHLGNAYLANRDYRRASDAFRDALKADPAFAPALEGQTKANAALEVKATQAAQAQTAENDQRLERIATQIKEAKFDDAKASLDSILNTNPTDAQRVAAQRLLLDLHLASGAQRLDRLDKRGAEMHFTRVLELDPENLAAREALLDVWKNDPSKREEVLKALQAKLRLEPDNLDLNQRVADLLMQLNRFQEAIGPLEKLFASPKYRAQGYGRQLESVLRETIQRQGDSGNYDAAIATMEKLMGFFPGTDGTQLSVLRYRKAVAAADPNDFDTRARLLVQLRDSGLPDMAVEEAQILISRAPNNESLLAILRFEAERQLAEIAESLSRREYAVARNMAANYATVHRRFPDLVAKSADLYERATIEGERQARAAREQARDIAQRAIEYYDQALRFAQEMRSTDKDPAVRPYSAKTEAIKYARRAIQSYEAALAIDRSLGPPSGMDLSARLGDAKALLQNLTRGADPLPNQQRRQATR